jgi:hypothetical protein
MCGERSEAVGHSDTSTTNLNVCDGVVAEMLARVAAGMASRTACNPEDAADFAKTVVASLLQARVVR